MSETTWYEVRFPHPLQPDATASIDIMDDPALVKLLVRGLGAVGVEATIYAKTPGEIELAELDDA